jgi:hypothetical protein
MKNTNTNEYKTALKKYLEPIIKTALTEREVSTEGNIYTQLVNVAKREVAYEFERNGMQAGLTYWLQGLGMGIDFYNGEIIRVCESLHDCKLSDKEAEKCVENWFNHIACKILQFSKEG